MINTMSSAWCVITGLHKINRLPGIKNKIPNQIFTYYNMYCLFEWAELQPSIESFSTSRCYIIIMGNKKKKKTVHQLLLHLLGIIFQLHSYCWTQGSNKTYNIVFDVRNLPDPQHTTCTAYVNPLTVLHFSSIHGHTYTADGRWYYIRCRRREKGKKWKKKKTE